MIFLDGLGVGENDPHLNPLAAHPDLWPTREHLPNWPGLHARLLDACLGVDGLPQSATGQTALLTGINAPGLLGRHLQGFPSSRLVEILHQHSIFVRIQRCGLRGTFANAYRHPEDIKPGSRLSVTSQALRVSGQPFRSVTQIASGEALYHDFSNRTLREQGYSAPLFAPRKAGHILVKLARQHDFTLYEHFLTDVVAHRGDKRQIARQVDDVSTFVRTILETIDTRSLTLVITSDHGNIEDCSTKTHTRNPVPLLWIGSSELTEEHLPEDITGVTPWVLSLLNCRDRIS